MDNVEAEARAVLHDAAACLPQAFAVALSDPEHVDLLENNARLRQQEAVSPFTCLHMCFPTPLIPWESGLIIPGRSVCVDVMCILY